MKILIADDEKLVRYSLKSMLEDIDIPSEAIHVACDGEEMVEKVRSIRPDLTFVDIRMPRLSGLEAIDRARALSPHTKWIILTSYSSFEYAKRAIALGAAEYLLKPVSPEDLSQAIRKIRGMNRQQFLRLNDEFEAQLNALFHNTLSTDGDAIDFISSAAFLGAILVFDSSLPEQGLLEQQLKVCSLIRKRLASAVDHATRAALCTLPEGQLALVGAWERRSGGSGAGALLHGLFRNVHWAVGSAMPDSVRVSQLLSEECEGYEELHKKLERVEKLAPLRVVVGIGEQISASEAEKQTALLPLSRSLVGLSEAFRGNSYLEFLRSVEELGETWKESHPSVGEFAGKQVLCFLKVTLDFQPSRGLEGDTWIQELRDHGERLPSPRGREHSGDLVTQVLRFVEKNFMKNIGIAQIAYDLGITPNYLSHLFHKRTGVTFIKYITRLRMVKARELLVDPSSRVQQVAGQVGYASTRHFSRLFKQHCGCYPSEFQRFRGPG